MASLARLSHAARFSSLPFLYPCFTTAHVPVRRAMMSALRDLPQHPLPETPGKQSGNGELLVYHPLVWTQALF